MPAPVVGTWATDLYSRLGPVADQDAALGWPLLTYLGAIGDTFFQDIENLVRDKGSQPGWAAALDPDQVPAIGLGWLAQMVGTRLQSNVTQAQQITWVKARAGFGRGTPAAMIAAIKPLLGGTQHVVLNERVGGNEYAVEVQLILAEVLPTVSMGQVLAAAISQKPAGVILTFNPALTTQTFAQLKAGYATFALAKAHYANFAAMKVG